MEKRTGRRWMSGLLGEANESRQVHLNVFEKATSRPFIYVQRLKC